MEEPTGPLGKAGSFEPAGSSAFPEDREEEEEDSPVSARSYGGEEPVFSFFFAEPRFRAEEKEEEEEEEGSPLSASVRRKRSRGTFGTFGSEARVPSVASLSLFLPKKKKTVSVLRIPAVPFIWREGVRLQTGVLRDFMTS